MIYALALVGLAAKPIKTSPFDASVGFAGLLLLCFAFAWDGLVRRQLLVPAYPMGAALGKQAYLIRRVGGILIGLVALIGTLFCLLVIWAMWMVAVQWECQPHTSALGCAGSLLRSTDFAAWAWFGLWALWFGLVWLRMGDPRKRTLAHGVWYRQDKVARMVNRDLRARGLPTLSDEKLVALQNAVLQVMRKQGWLVYGDWWMDGVARGSERRAFQASPATILTQTFEDSAFQEAQKNERAAIEFLLTYFATQAEKAHHMSKLRRWWVGTGQRGRLGVYGRRAL